MPSSACKKKTDPVIELSAAQQADLVGHTRLIGRDRVRHGKSLRSLSDLVVGDFLLLFFFLMIRRPPRSTLFPYRRSSDLTYAPHRTCSTRSPQTGSLGRRRPCSRGDRKSTRLNSSHSQISYAVFCLKK